MTENKRFYLDENGINDREYEFSILGEDELVDIINELNDENEQLKAQLYCDSEEGVCIICKHHYLEKTNIFYISKCEKGHEECSTDALKHCKDFEIKESKNE